MAGNVKKGSITIFLALILSLVLSLVCASIESVRMAAARTQILNSMDIGLYSLFGQYDRTLLEDYELFALYAGGKEELDMACMHPQAYPIQLVFHKADRICHRIYRLRIQRSIRRQFLEKTGVFTI